VVLGPLLPGEERRANELIDTGLGTLAPIEEPVASGGDSSLWDGDDDDDEDDEDGSKPK
jgi:hypothetical protein